MCLIWLLSTTLLRLGLKSGVRDKARVTVRVRVRDLGFGLGAGLRLRLELGIERVGG
jgi:hypothetical protein